MAWKWATAIPRLQLGLLSIRSPFRRRTIRPETRRLSARGGVVYNMVTKTGTNAFHGDFTTSGTNDNFQSDNLSPQLITDLRQSVPAYVLRANPGFIPSAKIVDMFNSSAVVSGPIMRDRLWFAVTGDYGFLNQYQLGTYNADGSRGARGPQET